MNGTPVDLAAVEADDALLDRLTAGEFDDLLRRAGVTYPASAVCEADELVLARVLDAWRRDVDAEPVGELVEPDEAVRVVARAVAARRVVLVLAAFVAAVVVVASAVGLVALDAEPGDLLWPVHELLYPKEGAQ